jgi:cell division protein FtsB
MVVLREMRRRARFLVGPVLGLAATGYFLYHLIEGNRGLVAWVRLNHEMRVAEANLAKVDAERADLSHRVADMRADHVDPDLLDEEIRRTLNYVSPNEIVIQLPHKPR